MCTLVWEDHDVSLEGNLLQGLNSCPAGRPIKQPHASLTFYISTLKGVSGYTYIKKEIYYLFSTVTVVNVLLIVIKPYDACLLIYEATKSTRSAPNAGLSDANLTAPASSSCSMCCFLTLLVV